MDLRRLLPTIKKTFRKNIGIETDKKLIRRVSDIKFEALKKNIKTSFLLPGIKAITLRFFKKADHIEIYLGLFNQTIEIDEAYTNLKANDDIVCSNLRDAFIDEHCIFMELFCIKDKGIDYYIQCLNDDCRKEKINDLIEESNKIMARVA